ncbi:uncharacterized protein EV422DRAFT_519015 [Fimicolochytrium jonesii]|uniref:uncharacterized protein n=1 Tax=Fimicolochytrium jonesii TaxID=1396493 RepID=UPI0022FE71B7|nr:uncharacterized protein EV422DRAFT_519015 [Fimicolochytrium jonesii]KAI8824136.1 hypothetical protein EV422DRAFT_519015 [Fimicolochytrium jonesii]
MPLLPTHPVSLVFYFKALSNPLSQGSAYTTSTPSASASATNLLAPIAKFATAPRRNSLMSFFRGGRSSSDETVVDSNNSSFSKPLPALPSGSPRRSTSGPDFMTSNLLVAEAEPTQSEWAEILQSATGTLIAPELELRTLEWKGGMVHGECVGKISCLIGFLPFMEEKVPRSFFPTTYAEYQMAVRITDWNQALSMEGHLWQLGGDVRKHYRRRYYRLTGAELHVYEAAPLPFVTGISWDESDFDPKTELPAPLEQSHGKHLLTIELAHCENWYAFSPIGQRYRTSSGGPTNASDDGSEPSQSDAAFNERDKLPDQRAAFVLLFKDGREIIFGIDPDEVERYQQESNKMLRSSETIRRECDGDGTQPALVEWQSSDIADMWKQALNEVLNGVKYETPLWWDALRASKGERKSEQLSEEAYELASRS